MRIIGLYLILLMLVGSAAIAQTAKASLEIVHNAKGSLRGMSMPNEHTIWVSGSEGTVIRSTDGGATWANIPVPGYEKSDFRDVEAFDENNAIIMAVTQPALLLQTRDGGKTWKEIFRDTTRMAFLDAMSFNSRKEGIVVADPVNGKDYKIWVDARRGDASKLNGLETFEKGEAFFAASGTNVEMMKSRGTDYAYVTGGTQSRYYIERRSSRFYVQGSFVELPFEKGKTTAGANSVSSIQNRYVVVVGGDFARPNDTTKTCFLSEDGGRSWRPASKAPSGYRSCVTHLTKEHLVATGINGVDVSEDGGDTWQRISTDGFHVVQQSANGKNIYLAGARGKIARLKWDFEQ